MEKRKRELVTELADSNPCYKEVSKMLDQDVGILLGDCKYKNTCSVIYSKDEMQDILDQLGKPYNYAEFEYLVRMAVYCWSYLNDMYCKVLSMDNVPINGYSDSCFMATVGVNLFNQD